MAKLNVPAKSEPVFTFEGAPAYRINSELMLRRSVCACLLWEDSFYEDGETTADRIRSYIPKVDCQVVANLAIEARERFKLRHVPLLLVREMARLPQYTGTSLVSSTLERVIQRPDEITEFLAIYWQNGRQPLSAQVKKGLAGAFKKFNEYQLAKYDRGEKIKLRDALFLCHAKPENESREQLWKRLIDGQLAVPDTWEVLLSANGNTAEAWEWLISEGKLPAMATLRNLRNMIKADVDRSTIVRAISTLNTARILPFRFITAAKYAPDYEPFLEETMFKCLEGVAKLPGRTVLLIDGSGSMFGNKISEKSELERFEAAAALSILTREICEDVTVFTFGDEVQMVPPRRGFALRDALERCADRGWTYTHKAVDAANRLEPDRIIIFTDEQSVTKINRPFKKGYVVNVANYEHGIGYGAWTHVDGFSEAVLDFITEFERL